ncbi:Hypothetical_protein [Hexamita inflata]|uniref:Hypothetical_protein n=1 Tax=Hexamita inflata TaxID=28002 RepID=A0ABP1HCU0_9EUKA
MLLSDGSVTCLRTQELTIEFMVVPHGINHNGPLYLQLIVLQIMHENSRFAQHFERYSSVYQKVLQYSIGCFRFIRAKFKLSNLCFSVSFGFILATQKLKLNLARRRDTVVRDMEIPRRAQYFIGMRSFQLACNFKVLKNGINSLETTLKATSNVFLGCNSL